MIYSVEANPSRQILGRVHRGRELKAALGELVEQYSLDVAWLSALGACEWIELTEYSQVGLQYEEGHRFERCELLSMVGNLSYRGGEPFWHLHATISRREDGKEVVYGGHVLDAVIFAFEFRIVCFDGLELRRTDDESTGLQLWSDEHADLVARPEEPTSASWARVAEASAEAAVREAEVVYAPMKGDWLDHPKFGLCKIEGLPGDGVCIIKLPDARRKKIKLSSLRTLAPREDGNRKIFPVTPKKA